MAGGFLRQWFGKSPPMRPDVAEAIGELDRASQDRPTLKDSLELLRKLLPVLYENRPPAPSVAISPVEGQARLAGVIPPLGCESQPHDDPAH